jgi:hypothetical protein
VAQGVGLELKPQYNNNNKKNQGSCLGFGDRVSVFPSQLYTMAQVLWARDLSIK